VDSLASDLNDDEGADPEDADGPTVEERLAAIEEKVDDSTEDESDEREELMAEIENLGESVSAVREKADAIDAKAQAVMDADGSSQQSTDVVLSEEELKALAEQAGGPNEDNRSKAQFFGAEKLVKQR
jgi:seryl-tRNA synthetase